MGYKRTYIGCAKLHPNKRECFTCTHTCALRTMKYIDNSLEKAEIERSEDIKELTEV